MSAEEKQRLCQGLRRLASGPTADVVKLKWGKELRRADRSPAAALLQIRMLPECNMPVAFLTLPC